MKTILMAATVLVVSACTMASPRPGDATALVIFSANPGHTLVASKVNGRAVESGRYFSVAPGHNKLDVLVVGPLGEEWNTNKFVAIEFSGFSPANTYTLKLVDRGTNKALRLSDGGGTVLAESKL